MGAPRAAPAAPAQARGETSGPPLLARALQALALALAQTLLGQPLLLQALPPPLLGRRRGRGRTRLRAQAQREARARAAPLPLPLLLPLPLALAPPLPLLLPLAPPLPLLPLLPLATPLATPLPLRRPWQRAPWLARAWRWPPPPLPRHAAPARWQSAPPLRLLA
jgi:hypothetical protein